VRKHDTVLVERSETGTRVRSTIIECAARYSYEERSDDRQPIRAQRGASTNEERSDDISMRSAKHGVIAIHERSE
jgi:hypothetical protein